MPNGGANNRFRMGHVQLNFRPLTQTAMNNFGAHSIADLNLLGDVLLVLCVAGQEVGNSITQNKSLHVFAGEAYNVEMGISNLLFPNERDDTPGCNPVGSFNDSVNLSSIGYDQFDDVTMFGAFMRLSAPPAPAPATVSSAQGKAVFSAVGCSYCHSPVLQTGVTTWGTSLNNQTIAPYSDFALHHMGPALADRISQGVAQGDEFRTAPLWGLGQRLFFLHDGRTSDLVAAINAHASLGNATFGPSEANTSVSLSNLQTPANKQALLAFLRSL